MRFTLEHPLGQHECGPDLYNSGGLVEVAEAAEKAGFDALAFTEHPAPSAKWLDAGGHLSVDPLAALAFCSAVTTRMRLLTYLLVLPYHNPLLVAKTIATVDRLSQGRLIVGVGGGYLRSEFAAVGADFDHRGRLLDEALEVLRGLWVGESYSVEGSGYRARDVVSQPGPVQLPHPPLWIGGSGRNARRRAARVGQGWTPLLLDEQVATATRTAALTTVEHLAEAVRELRVMMTDAGRDPGAMEIQVGQEGGEFGLEPHKAVERHRDFLGRLADAGATSYVVRLRAGSRAEFTDGLAEYASAFIA
jgi:probable F420-dependent oxidoreductase